MSCQTGLDHCHGTLVRHTDGGADCTDQGCADLNIVRHDLVIECHTIEGGCGCADEPAGYAELPWAS